MSVTPLILGSGGSGKAIAKSLASVAITEPKLNLKPAVFLERGCDLAEIRKQYEDSVLCIASPHALHANAILEADAAGYSAILCEKPAAVNAEQVQLLQNVKTPTALFHVYRQTWGMQMLKKMMIDQEFGEIISIEGRYWQASTASLTQEPGVTKTWKDDPKLSGLFDVYLDLGTHWADAVSFLYGSMPTHIAGFRSFINASSAHRDSYVRLIIEYANQKRALATISKNVHGASNQFEISILGSKQTAHWRFLQADEIEIGVGRDRKILTRKSASLGSRQAPFHGVGWAEGYIEISSQLLKEVFLNTPGNYPKLSEQLELLSSLFRVEWQ